MPDRNPTRYVLETVLAAVEVARRVLLAALGRGPDSLNDIKSLLAFCEALARQIERVKREYLESVVRELTAHHYLTNDLVEIVGDFSDPDREFKLNGRTIPGLDQRESIVIRKLAENSAALQKLSEPEALEASTFVSVKDILAEIKAMRDDGRLTDEQWPYPGAEDVHKAVARLRESIRSVHGNQFLIESGPRGAGYRLSTPSANVLITPRRNAGGGETA